MTFKSYIREQKESLLASLQALLRIPSVESAPQPDAPFGAAVRQVQQQMEAECRALGFTPVDVDGRVGFIEYGEGAEMVAVVGHLDVVPAGEGWVHEPFGGAIEDGRIYGRGTMDDKGPMIAALYALAALRESGVPLRRRIRLLYGLNEETGCEDLAYYLAHGGEAPVMGITPDGAYPIINGEKGILTCAYTHPLRDNRVLLSFSGGTASNVVPNRAEAVLRCPAAWRDLVQGDGITATETTDGIRVQAEGIAAHGSTPEQGVNAIGRLAIALSALPLTGDAAEAIGFLATHIGMQTRGEALGIAMQDEVSGDLTVNLGVVCCDDNALTVQLSVRYPVTKSYEDAAPPLRAAFAAGGFAESEMAHKTALYVPPESELIRTLQRVYTAECGLPATLLSIGGGTYAKELPNTVAFGPAFPGDEVREHMAEEYMEIDRLLQNAEMLAAALYELAK